MSNEFPLALSQDETFAQSETDFITKNFVCAICHADLQVVFMPNEARVLIVCIEHGNVCITGRVTHATVSIEMERSYRAFHKVVRNLSDLWGDLVEKTIPPLQVQSIIKFCVCEVCGNSLQIRDTQEGQEVHCRAHGNIQMCGYIERNKYKYNYKNFTQWEKEHPNQKVKKSRSQIMKELTGV